MTTIQTSCSFGNHIWAGAGYETRSCICGEVTIIQTKEFEGLNNILRDHANELANATGYLSRLFSTIAPQCRPSDDLLVLCTQIDNYIAGRLKEIDRLTQEKTQAELIRDRNVEDCINGVELLRAEIEKRQQLERELHQLRQEKKNEI